MEASLVLSDIVSSEGAQVCKHPTEFTQQWK